MSDEYIDELEEKITDLEAVIVELQRVVSEQGKKLRRCRIEKRKLKREFVIKPVTR